MKIEVYGICWNEEILMPHFLKHYGEFADKIYLYDNGSTDETLQIIKECPQANVKQFNTNNKIRDDAYLVIKNHCWKNSNADYVIIVDTDEFLYHPDIRSYLKEYSHYDVFAPSYWDMIVNHIPQSDEILTETAKRGLRQPRSPKMVIFKPKIEAINYFPGCHAAQPATQKLLRNNELKTLHYRYFTADHLVERFKVYSKRLSNFNKLHKLGYHYLTPEAKLRKKFAFLDEYAPEII
jgi:glycosyltransferase involved in cell wall biosynthesis